MILVRKQTFLLLAVIMLPVLNFAQEIELIPYASYHWGGKAQFYEGELKFNDSENYGIALNVLMPTGTAIQLEYMMQPTDMDVRLYRSGGLSDTSRNYPINMNWFQIGGLQQITRGQLAPFAGFTLGALYSNPQTSEIEAIWKFAITGQLGLKYYINDRIGIRIHAGMLVPIQWGGFGFYFGSGGSGAGVTTGSTILQGEIGGGLIIRLNSGSS